MKIKFFLISLFILNSIQSQTIENDVKLTVIGQGKTIDEAKYNALRGAIEEAFGAFISTNTIVLNETIIKDEILSVSNGNINKYQILSQNISQEGV